MGICIAVAYLLILGSTVKFSKRELSSKDLASSQAIHAQPFSWKILCNFFLTWFMLEEHSAFFPHPIKLKEAVFEC